MNWLVMGLSALEEAVLIIVGIILFVVFIIWFIDSLSKAVIIKKANKNFLIGFVPRHHRNLPNLFHLVLPFSPLLRYPQKRL